MQDQAQSDPNAIGFTEIIIPLALSLFCGIGGFVWGLVRFAQGHKKPGWVAVGINAGMVILGGIGFAVLAAIGMAGASHAMQEAAASSPSAGTPEQLAERPTVQVTAREMFSDYQGNEVRANAKYQGKNVVVSGTVSKVSADIMDEPVVDLESGNMILGVSLHDLPASAAGALNNGENITALCTEVSEVAGAPQLGGCSLQGPAP